MSLTCSSENACPHVLYCESIHPVICSLATFSMKSDPSCSFFWPRTTHLDRKRPSDLHVTPLSTLVLNDTKRYRLLWGGKFNQRKVWLKLANPGAHGSFSQCLPVLFALGIIWSLNGLWTAHGHLKLKLTNSSSFYSLPGRVTVILHLSSGACYPVWLLPKVMLLLRKYKLKWRIIWQAVGRLMEQIVCGGQRRKNSSRQDQTSRSTRQTSQHVSKSDQLHLSFAPLQHQMYCKY